jgi:hypothetical protein
MTMMRWLVTVLDLSSPAPKARLVHFDSFSRLRGDHIMMLRDLVSRDSDAVMRASERDAYY